MSRSGPLLLGAVLLPLLLGACSGSADAPPGAAAGRSSSAPAPSPTTPVAPSPSMTHASPGPEDHPISLYDGDGALVLLTVRRLDRVGTATLWRKDPGGWRRLGTLKHAVPPERVDPSRTHLLTGPGSRALVALDLAQGRIATSRDGGATWRYLAEPAACAHRTCSPVYSTAADYRYVDVGRTVMRAAFGTSAWEEIAVPHGRGAPDRYAGLLALDDALLAVDSDCDTTPNHYRVSRDHGDTWSGSRDFPAHTCIYGSAGRAAYAADAYETQWWRSRDLVHWEHAPSSPYDVLARRYRAACPGSGRDRLRDLADGPPVRIGDDVYRLARLRSGDARVLELRVSHDDCRTWQRVPTALARSEPASATVE